MKYNFPQKNKKQNLGFTLVETLVAISIFTASLLAVISVLSSGITSTNYAKTKLTASYLAEEGIEYIRNMRDTFVLYDSVSAQHGWDAFNTKLTGASCQAANGCYFGDLADSDYANAAQPIDGLSLTACSTSCPSMLYNSSAGKYGYTSGSASAFKRKISIIQISANETKIFSTVYWTQGTGSYSEVFSESLFNWVE